MLRDGRDCKYGGRRARISTQDLPDRNKGDFQGEGDPGEIEVDFYPFTEIFCIFKKREENNDRGLQVDGKEEEERV